ncbi:MAG TPA: hypothetical protein VMB18_04790 [Terriglobales bacterium]|nr:hypothetical protein [Terriglobales bacterium]
MIRRFVALLIFSCSLFAQQTSQPSLTIYNQDFAVVREQFPLDLKSGENQVNVNDITMHLEPDSVILRDPGGKHSLQVLEQNYRADPVSQSSLLALYEGRTIDFEAPDHSIIKGKVVRSGFVRADFFNVNNGYQQYPAQEEPIIEVNGQLRFGLPGTPIFPDLTAETILKPRLEWLLATDKPGKFPAEFSYITGGFTWQADYNVIAPEKGDLVDIIGWVTMDNRSGKTFENARIKLMAGDVNKLRQQAGIGGVARATAQALEVNGAPPVSEKAFDEYHLYTLERSTTLRDRESKQVEFIRAVGVTAKQLYIYDGLKLEANRYYGWNFDNIRNDHSYGTESNPKVWVMREFRNSEANHLGMPLPKGRLRFYRRNDDGQVEFTGENTIEHTPKDETVRVYTGNAFDLVGERRRTDYTVDTSRRTANESFEIKIRNHKKEPVEVRVVEHLYRALNWDINSSSTQYNKIDSHTIEFPVTVAPDSEQVITYAAHYTW